MTEPEERDDCIEMDPTDPVPMDGRLDDTESPPADFVVEPADAGDTEGDDPA